jgi:hypothetical protein
MLSRSENIPRLLIHATQLLQLCLDSPLVGFFDLFAQITLKNLHPPSHVALKYCRWNYSGELRIAEGSCSTALVPLWAHTHAISLTQEPQFLLRKALHVPFEAVLTGEVTRATHDTLRFPERLAAAEGSDATSRRRHQPMLKQRLEKGEFRCFISTWALEVGIVSENLHKLVHVCSRRCAVLVNARIAKYIHGPPQSKHV